MTVTFSIPSVDAAYKALPCPACGLAFVDIITPWRDDYCRLCADNGGSSGINPFFLNVANGNAGIILRACGLDASDPCGGMSGERALEGARVLYANAERLTRAPFDDEGMGVVITPEGVSVKPRARFIDCGRDADDVRRYAKILTLLGVEACRLGEEISYG